MFVVAAVVDDVLFFSVCLLFAVAVAAVVVVCLVVCMFFFSFFLSRLVQYISNSLSYIHVIFFCTLVLGSTNIFYYIPVKLSVISLFI